MLDRVVIRPFREEDDAIPPITCLLHSAYARLAEMGFRYTATHQDDEVTLKRLRRGSSLFAELDGEIVGTISLYAPEPESRCEWYRREGVHSFGQFAVRPDLQGGGLGSRLLQIVEDMARERAAAELALDTAEGARHLIEWYGRRGYREVDRVAWGTTNYTSVILSKKLHPATS
jgi:GNAT superfamily N-acetyltransferase